MAEKREIPDKLETASSKKVKSSDDSNNLSRDVLRTEYLEQSFEIIQINCADGKIKVKLSQPRLTKGLKLFKPFRFMDLC